MDTIDHSPLSGEIVGAAAAGSRTATDGSAAPAAKQDPTTKYPRPPFDGQSQPWPGLSGKMSPVPDHGETSYVGSNRLRGRKALITGGDSGMGRAAAIAFAREGADVAINYLADEEPDAREVVDLIRREGRIAVAIPGDIRSEAFCTKLVADAHDGLGGLDIVVSNAGRQQANASILDISTDQFDWTIKTNIYAMFWIIKAALPHLQPGSAIIVTTSEQAYDPSKDLFDYAMTKAAGMNAVKSLAKQLGPKGIRRQRRRTRSDLDPAPGQRRRDAGEIDGVRRPDPARSAGPASGTRIDLRSAGRQRCKLCDWTGLWCGRRQRSAVTPCDKRG